MKKKIRFLVVSRTERSADVVNFIFLKFNPQPVLVYALDTDQIFLIEKPLKEVVKINKDKNLKKPENRDEEYTIPPNIYENNPWMDN